MPDTNLVRLLRTELDRPQGEGAVQGRAADRVAAAAPTSRVERPGGRELLREQLPRAGQPSGDRRRRRTTGLKTWGYGLSSVRFICGTQDIHKRVRSSRSPSSSARRTRSCTSRASTPTADCSSRCSASRTRSCRDELNHASIIDGVRLCKAQRFRYKHNDMADLKAKLEEAKGCRFKHDLHRQRLQHGRRPGEAARDLRPRRPVRRHRRHRRLPRHRPPRARPAAAAAEELGVLDRIDIITGTLGKTLGGASGGFTAAQGGSRRLAAEPQPAVPVQQLACRRRWWPRA